jgi:hypothetical protein
MPDLPKLNPQLLATEPLSAGDPNLMATVEAHGQYMPLSFVLRLSPIVHRTLASLPRAGIVSSQEIGLDGAQAFSTYLHETVHWWQHVGSTYGLMSSLSFPAQTHSNFMHIKKLQLIGKLKKPIRRVAETATGPSSPETVKGLSNIIINNYFDVGAFSRFSYNEEFAREVANSPYFENVGHQLHMSYAHILTLLSGVNDKTFKTLPDPRKWSATFQKLKKEKEEGFYYGSRVGLWPVGAREIMESPRRSILHRPPAALTSVT